MHFYCQKNPLFSFLKYTCMLHIYDYFLWCLCDKWHGYFVVEISALLEELHCQVFVDEGSAGVDNQLCMGKDLKKECAFFSLQMLFR